VHRPNSVEAFYAMYLSWAVPRPRFDVLLCWMIQSGRCAFHQSLFMPYPHSTNPSAAIKAFSFVQEPWKCTLPDIWLICFKGPDATAFYPSPHEVKDSPRGAPLRAHARSRRRRTPGFDLHLRARMELEL